MIRPSRPIGKLLLTVAIAAAGSGSALASTVTLSYSTTSNGTTGTGTVTTLAVPGTDIYGNALTARAGRRYRRQIRRDFMTTISSRSQVPPLMV